MVIPRISYQIVARHSQLLLDVRGGPTASRDGIEIQQYEDLEEKPNQQWNFFEVEPGYYKIAAVHSGRVLDVRGGPNATQNHRPLQQYQYLGNDNQKFKVEKLGGDYVRITPKHSPDKALDVTGGVSATGNGARVQMYSWHGEANQQWKLIPLREIALEVLIPPMTEHILDAARGLLEGEVERKLRGEANKGAFGNIGRIERLSGEWLTDGVIERLSQNLPSPSEPLERYLREAIIGKKGFTPLHWLGFSLKWFVQDFIKLGQDDCDISARAFVFWNIKDGQLSFEIAPITLEDVDLGCGISLAEVFIAFAKMVIALLNLASTVLVDKTVLASIPVQIGGAVSAIETREQINDTESRGIGIKDLFVANYPPRFVVVLQW